jgi:hypothetical protein
MDDLQSALLAWTAITVLFLLAAGLIWWRRRPRHQTIPRAPKQVRELRLPSLPRTRREAIPEVEIAPSRLARIKATPVEPRAADPFVPPEPAPPPAALERTLDAMASEVEARAAEGPIDDTAVRVRLVPQIPLRDAIQTRSRLGGRPRLPAALDWPRIDGVKGDFLAQIACADLPPDLWDGLGPREGWLAVFAHPMTGEAIILHLAEDGPPREAPQGAGDAIFAPHGGVGFGDFAALAVRAFPEWPVDVVAVRPGDSDPRDEAAPGDMTDAADYDIADPAFHPFDWDSLRLMAAVLDRRLARLVGGGEANRAAAENAAEIVAIIRDSADQHPFTAADATAVMAALHAIRWVPDAAAGPALPLTRHDPRAPLWVHEYRALLFDHAKHAWCADPSRLSAPARAYFEPLWQDLAAREMAAMGPPALPLPGFDPEREAVLLELPTSGLMSRRIGEEEGALLLIIRKADLAAGDFSKVRTLRTR